jgi:uridine kinase
VLLFDGVFLLHPQLRGCWDVGIFRRRYLPAQDLYRADAAPEASADVVIDNTDPARPHVVKWPA